MRRVCFVALALALSFSSAYGAITSCPTGTATDGAFSIPASGGTTNQAGTYNGNALDASGKSCDAVDKNFSNMQTNGGGPLDSNHTYFFTNNPANPLTTPVGITFATLRGDLSGGEGTANDGVNDYTVTGTASVNNPLTDTFTYLTTVDTTVKPLDRISAITLRIFDVSLGSGPGSGGTFTVSTCTGVTNGQIDNTFSAAQCANHGGVYLASAFSVTLANGNNTVSYTLPAPALNIALNTTWNVQSGKGSTSTSSWLTWEDDFSQVQITPEPSTFALLGIALTGVWLKTLEWKRRQYAGARTSSKS